MKFANVVPIRRMPPDLPWLTYLIDDSTSIEPGSLVSIPLRGKPQLGIVWEIVNTPPDYQKLEVIADSLIKNPISTPWQCRICEVIAHTSSTSLGDVFLRVVPKLTARRLVKTLSGITLSTSSSQVAQPAANFLWYRARSEVGTLIRNVCLQVPQQPIVIVTPTVESVLELIQLVESLGRAVVYVHGKLAPTVYASWYRRVLNGEPIVVIGGIGALTLPFDHQPTIIFDQEEHPAHKQTSQFPHYDARVVLNQLALPLIVTTPAPSLELYRRTKPTIPAMTANRSVLSLQGPQPRPMVSEEALTLIDATVEKQQRIVCISPRSGYASASVCRSCGTAIICPHCGRNASIFRGIADEARCRSCQTSIPLTTSCINCGSSDWSFHGFGIEQTVASLQQLRPELSVAPVLRPEVITNIAVDTYRSTNLLRRINAVGLVIIINGDSLLNSPDFSVAERAWQFLARVQADVDRAILTVQTFQSASEFWQRWLHYDDRTWYTEELLQRQRLHIPPFYRQWIASYRGERSVVENKMSTIESSYGQIMSVRYLPQRNPRPNEHRLLLDFTDANIDITIPWVKIFPLPWHLDQFPTSWLD